MTIGVPIQMLILTQIKEERNVITGITIITTRQNRNHTIIITIQNRRRVITTTTIITTKN
mgnify:CR=1 FL=1